MVSLGNVYLVLTGPQCNVGLGSLSDLTDFIIPLSKIENVKLC